MPVPRYMHELNLDLTKAKIKKGKLIVPTELGWDIIYTIELPTSIEKYINYEQPNINSTLHITKMILGETPKSMNSKKIEEYLKNKPITGSSKWSDLMVGFVYADDSDPLNHTWMIQYRNELKEITNNFYADSIDLDCNFSTESWFDGGWHQRILIQPEDVDTIVESYKGGVIIMGPNVVQIDGERKLLLDCDRLRLRCIVKSNLWCIEFLSKDKKILKTLTFAKITGSVPMTSFIDFDHPKPWVSYLIEAEDVGHLVVVGDTLSIFRRKQI